NLPILHVRMGECEARLVVDTGAGYHALDKQFADSAGIPTQSSERAGVDLNGRTTPLGIAPHVAMKSGSVPLYDGPAIIVKLPGELRRMGIVGLFSPQYLAPAGASVVIDLLRGHVGVMNGPLTEKDRAGPGYALAPGGMRICRGDSEKVGGFYLV